jgi:membrane dipeptidase
MLPQELLERARALHHDHPVVSCHGDVPVDLYRRRRSGEGAPLRDDWANRLRTGGVRFEFMTVGGDVPAVHDPDGSPYFRALQTIGDLLEEAIPGSGLRPVRTPADLDGAVAADEIGVVLHLEGLAPVLRGGERAPELLHHLHDLGLRSAQLTWNGRNEAADGVGVDSPRGLSELGKLLVAELERLGAVVDVSHLAEPGFWDVLDVTGGPICASHANARAVHRHTRNLTDEQVLALARRGGYVGVCFLPAFIGAEPSLDGLLDHVDHLVELAGVDAVAIGPDYAEFAADLVFAGPSRGIDYGPKLEFPEGLRRVETLPVLTAGLLARGYSETDSARILGGNALRVLRAVLPGTC